MPQGQVKGKRPEKGGTDDRQRTFGGLTGLSGAWGLQNPAPSKLTAEAKTVQSPSGHGAAASPSAAPARPVVGAVEEKKECGDPLTPPTPLGSIITDALGVKVHQGQPRPLKRMMCVLPTRTIDGIMVKLGQWTTSNKLRSLIIALATDSVKEALQKRGVIVTKVQVDVPAAIFNRYSRVSVEARRVTVTVCEDGERAAAWEVLEGPGPGVLLNLGTTSAGAWLERVVGTPRRLSWCLTAHLEGEERPSWVKGRIQAVMQSAGMGPAELVEVGQAGVDAFAPWVQILLPEEAGM